MASNQLYSLLYVIADGALLVEEGSCSMTRSSGAQQILTTAKGFAGMSPGAAMCEIDVDSAIPAAGFEVDFGSKIASLTEVEMALMNSNNQRAIVKGFITEDSVKHSVNSPSSLSFKFVGPMPQWQ